MSIVRLIYVTVKEEQKGEAEEVWRKECAPLMIQQQGCMSEKLLRCKDNPGEYISYSEWDSMENIDAYLGSEAHGEIKSHTASLKGERPVVKCYEVVP